MAPSPAPLPSRPHLTDDGIPDPQLIARIRAGDEAAYSLCFHRYWRMLCGFANRCLGSADAAEDIVQGVFVRLWEERELWHIESNLRAYLFAAVRNAVLNALRHDGVLHRIEQTQFDAPGMGAAPEAADVRLEHEEMVRAVRQTLATFPARRRIVATLRWYAQMTHAEIAQALGISPATVNNHLTLALRELRRALR